MPSNKLVGKNGSPCFTRLTSTQARVEAGFAPMLLMLLAAAGVIAFLLFSSTASFKNKLFSSLYPKPASHASEPTISGNPETSFILELERDPNPPYPINPTPSNIQVGNNFRVDIYARSDFYAANLFVAKLNFPADAVEVVSIDERGTNSLATQWPEASFDNTTGKISIVGGVISPGVKTNANANYLFATIIFKAKKTSSVNVSFAPESAIYSNANNTNLLTEANNLRGVNFEVVDIAPTPTPTPTPPPAAPAVVSCTGTTVTGATLTQTTTGQVYTAIPTATVTFTANYTPTTNTTISWTGPSTGTFTTNSTTGISSWVVPTVTAAQSYTTKATITLNSATTDCPLINLSVSPPLVVVPPTPPPTSAPIILRRDGDINSDHIWNYADLSALLTLFIPSRTGVISEADLQEDGIINAFDYSKLLAILTNKRVIGVSGGGGTTTPPALVPNVDFQMIGANGARGGGSFNINNSRSQLYSNSGSQAMRFDIISLHGSNLPPSHKLTLIICNGDLSDPALNVNNIGRKIQCGTSDYNGIDVGTSGNIYDSNTGTASTSVLFAFLPVTFRTRPVFNQTIYVYLVSTDKYKDLGGYIDLDRILSDTTCPRYCLAGTLPMPAFNSFTSDGVITDQALLSRLQSANSSFFPSFNVSRTNNSYANLLLGNGEIMAGSDKFNINLWVNPSSTVSDNIILAQTDSMKLSLDGQNKLHFWYKYVSADPCIRNSGNSLFDCVMTNKPLANPHELISNTSIPLNQWTHIDIGFSNDTLTLYLNGQKDTQTQQNVAGKGVMMVMPELDSSGAVIVRVGQYGEQYNSYPVTTHLATSFIGDMLDGGYLPVNPPTEVSNGKINIAPIIGNIIYFPQFTTSFPNNLKIGTQTI